MNAYQAYRRTEAETASPAQLVVMLYRGAVRFAAASVVALEAHDVEAAHNQLVRAQAIVTELLTSLDRERGGDVARNLGALYEFIGRLLVEANVRKDPGSAREAERLLRELLEAWEAAARASADRVARAPVAA